MCIDAAGGWSPSGRISRWLWLFVILNSLITSLAHSHLSLFSPNAFSRMTGDERATNFSTEGDREIERLVCFPCGRPLVRQASIVLSGLAKIASAEIDHRLSRWASPSCSQLKKVCNGWIFLHQQLLWCKKIIDSKCKAQECWASDEGIF